MILEHFLLSVNETNGYIIACTETAEAAIIDPGEWNEKLANFLDEAKLKPKWALLTHSHADHTAGIEACKKAQPVQTAGHVQNPFAEHKLSDGDILELGSLKIKALGVPGHTQDSLAFQVGSEIFCGDAIFAGSVGGTSDAQRFQQLIQAIRSQILSLGDDIVLHPGHGPATTVQIERLFNPFLMI